MTLEAKPMSEYRQFHALNDSLNLAIDRSDLGETKSIEICLYPHKDSLPKLTKFIEHAALTDLQKQVDELKQQIADYEKALEKIKNHDGHRHSEDTADTAFLVLPKIRKKIGCENG